MPLKLKLIIHFLGHESRHMKVHFSARKKRIELICPLCLICILQIRRCRNPSQPTRAESQFPPPRYKQFRPTVEPFNVFFIHVSEVLWSMDLFTNIWSQVFSDFEDKLYNFVVVVIFTVSFHVPRLCRICSCYFSFCLQIAKFRPISWNLQNRRTKI